MVVKKAWRVIPRPIWETALNDHVHNHHVKLPLFFHGPRGTGKTTLINDRLIGEWNKRPHVAGYVDLGECVGDHHPRFGHSFPWSSWSTVPSPLLSDCRLKIESCLESMAHSALALGLITSRQVFSTLDKWHSISPAALGDTSFSPKTLSRPESKAALWDRAVFAKISNQSGDDDGAVLEVKEGLSVEEALYHREGAAALKLAKEVIDRKRGCRAEAIRDMNQTGRLSRSLANSFTDWPCLLFELISEAAQTGHFEPKLVINNIELLKLATLSDDELSVSGTIYHDNLLWRIIELGSQSQNLPIILVTSDGYYSYKGFQDFGDMGIFISRENFGWTPQEASLHMVPNYFSESEYNTITEVFGANPRHLFELYALKLSNDNEKMGDGKSGKIEDIIDAYLAYLQVSVVNPAMEQALKLLQKFAADAQSGKIPKEKMQFGAPWRHPPKKDDPALQLEWAKTQLMDCLQSLIKTGFALNYLADYSEEIFDDPAALALIEVGLYYISRDPCFIRPVSRGIQRCMVRWFIQERIQMSLKNKVEYYWQRFKRGRHYSHLLWGQLGYK